MSKFILHSEPLEPRVITQVEISVSRFIELIPVELRGRFLGKVDMSGACWIWLKAKESDGYGVWAPRLRRQRRVHRLTYSWVFGPIPEGLTIDHVRARGCASRACFNPNHLEAVTHRVNIMRGDGLAAVNANKSDCWRGHPLSGENLFPNQLPKRRCRECARIDGKIRAERHPDYDADYRKRNIDRIRQQSREATRRYRERLRARAEA